MGGVHILALSFPVCFLPPPPLLPPPSLPPPSPLLPPPSQVVMAVVQLYYHLAPQSEQGVVTKAFIRLLKGHRSVSVCLCLCVCVCAGVRVGGCACIDCVK